MSLITACDIKNDIPYPIVDGAIEAMEVEGQCDAEGNPTTQATINKKERTVKLYVDDTVNKQEIRITKLMVSNEATYTLADKSVCLDEERFPTTGFPSLNDLPKKADTRVNFSKPLGFKLHTYQDYDWTVSLEQVILRKVLVQNQVGNAVVDDFNRSVVIYVSKNQPLHKIQVSQFDLGGQHGTVVPNPCEEDFYDFSQMREFQVTEAWEGIARRWTVHVFHKEEPASLTANAFPMATRAYLDGSVVGGKQPTIEYKKESESDWQALSAASITIVGTKYTAELKSLQPGTTYQFRITVDGETGSAQDFTTAPATQIPNGSMDSWHQDGRLWNPWAENGEKFWDTGNRGATTVGESNSVPTDETSTGSGRAAMLQSKWIVLKFAAGNIFTGDYVRTTGTNGVLSFGRPFTSFPSKLRFNYKYNMSTINRVGDDDYEYLKGRPDTANVYIALTDWDEPLEIRTRPSERQLFDRNDPHIIAFAELLQGETVSNWTQVDLTLNYRYRNRRPKYILIVASSSKFGDFFTGGDASKLWIDDFELIYE